ncbi:type I restriction enzyme S subunit [Gramella sp. Hel_I_59]|uniref:restriction endonuclease subunit S n=1 Tax=Gramella sp. Hel_I_59 TaxID=1249978 RepID=UPI0011533D13|nr:restriction endonuclease subunit S [Gramella sp. Hel_I_59]TQI71432.1 type I restriction enzyme S subunit [Gramella sp. Hel_I_59]
MDNNIKDLPENWKTYSLQDLIDNNIILSHLDGNHGSLYPRKEEFIEKGVPYISANCIEGDSISFEKAKYLSNERAKKFKKGVAKNRDVLFAHNATVGPVALLDTDEDFVILGTSLTYYRCNEKFLKPEYLKHYLSSQVFKNQYLKVMGQATRNQVPITKQRTFSHIVPPLAEQKHIIGKLDRLFERIDQAISLLEENISNTEALMGSVLDEEFQRVKGKGWPTLKFTEFASLRHGHQFRKYDFVDSGIPVVKIGQCKKDGSLNLSNCNYIESSRLNEFEGDRIYKGDLLMALTGGTLGKVTWVSEDYGDLVQNYRVGNFFNIEGKSIKRFLMYVLMSSIFQDLVASKVNQGAQPNIGKENIDNMIVPVPSIKEQEKLVRKFDVAMKNQSKIIEFQTQKLNHLKVLKSSLLDQAFKGEL